VETNFLDIEPSTNIHNHILVICQRARYVEGCSKRNENRLVCPRNTSAHLHLRYCSIHVSCIRSIALIGSQSRSTYELFLHSCPRLPRTGIGSIPWTSVETPVAILRRHSLNFACAARSCWKEFVRCSSSSSSCFFTWLSCWVERDARSTVRC
jgi:hypothetical protein